MRGVDQRAVEVVEVILVATRFGFLHSLSLKVLMRIPRKNESFTRNQRKVDSNSKEMIRRKVKQREDMAKRLSFWISALRVKASSFHKSLQISKNQTINSNLPQEAKTTTRKPLILVKSQLSRREL
jgi:hypothetical protein